MQVLRFKPLFDKLFFIILIPTALLVLAISVFTAMADLRLLALGVAIDIFVGYFLVTPVFGYVELRENTLFIKYGIIMKREIPYSKIRGAEKGRKIYSESMMSLKNALEHVNIRYNRFDVTTVSVVDNDGFIRELSARASLSLRD